MTRQEILKQLDDMYKGECTYCRDVCDYPACLENVTGELMPHIIKELQRIDRIVELLERELELVVTQFPLHGRYIKKNRAIEIVKGGDGNEI